MGQVLLCSDRCFSWFESYRSPHCVYNDDVLHCTSPFPVGQYAVCSSNPDDKSDCGDNVIAEINTDYCPDSQGSEGGAAGEVSLGAAGASGGTNGGGGKGGAANVSNGGRGGGTATAGAAGHAGSGGSAGGAELFHAKAVAVGGAFACAITPAGAVECWGENDKGQLGNPNVGNSSVPVPVIALTSGVQAIAAGAFVACAIDANGAVSCWGDNSSGLLGSGFSGAKSATPVAVLSDVDQNQYESDATTVGARFVLGGRSGRQP